MKLSPDFEKFLSFIPEILSRDESFLRDLESCTRGVTIRKGDYLIRTGELCQDAYFINKGLFINQYINENGNECVTGFSSDSMYPFVSTIGYFTQVPSEFEAKAGYPNVKRSISVREKQSNSPSSIAFTSNSEGTCVK